MSKVERPTVKHIRVCDLCGEDVEKNDKRLFQLQKQYKEERPLKTAWYEVVLRMFDDSPSYDVHHSCLYELLYAYKEGNL